MSFISVLSHLVHNSIVAKFIETLSWSVVFTIGIAVALLWCYCLARIAYKTNTPGLYRAYIPVINIFLLYDLAQVSYSLITINVISGVLPYTVFKDTLAASFAYYANLAVYIYVWYRLCIRLGKSPWISLVQILPFGSLFILFYLAFTDTTIVATSSQASHAAHGWQHPELRPGETFIDNFSTDDFDKKVHWQSKRMGDAPYDRLGNRLSDPLLHPVFAAIEELRKAGINSA